MKAEHAVLIVISSLTVALMVYTIMLLTKLKEASESKEKYSLGEYYKLKACRCGTEYDAYQDQFRDEEY